MRRLPPILLALALLSASCAAAPSPPPSTGVQPGRACTDSFSGYVYRNCR